MDAVRISRARPQDAARLAELHMDGFGTNALLRAMYPTPDAYGALQANLAAFFRILAEQEKYGTYFPIAVDCSPSGRGSLDADQGASPGGGEERIVSYAMVEEPMAAESKEENDLWKSWQWPEAARTDVIAKWQSTAAACRDAVLAGPNAFSLLYIATDPACRGRGIGTRLMRHVMDAAGESGAPVYLESTVDALPYYKKLGFRDEAQIRMPLESGDVYTEHSMVWRP